MSVSMTSLIQSWAVVMRKNYVKAASFLHSLVSFVSNMNFDMQKSADMSLWWQMCNLP